MWVSSHCSNALQSKRWHVVCKPFFVGVQPVFCNGVVTYVLISMTVEFSDQCCFTLGILKSLVRRSIFAYLMLMCYILLLPLLSVLSVAFLQTGLVYFCNVTTGRIRPHQQGKQEPVKSPLSSQTHVGFWWLYLLQFCRHKCVLRTVGALFNTCTHNSIWQLSQLWYPCIFL